MPSFIALDDTVVARTGPATAGWTSFTNLQDPFNAARISGKPLFFQPGNYASGETTINTGNGSGRPLRAYATPGTVKLQFTGTTSFIRVDGVSDVEFEGLSFDGQNRALTAIFGRVGALIAVRGQAKNVRFSNCSITNSPGIGIFLDTGAQVTVSDCQISNQNFGLWSNDAVLYARDNRITNSTDNAIAVWRSTLAPDNSIIRGNVITSVNNVSGGTGEYGNGILVFRAIGVQIIDNQIFSTRYSAIRCNGGGSFIITNNYCLNTREVAIFIEAPSPGINLTGTIVSNNIIRLCGNGINVVNSGQFNDGISRLVVVSGNLISNILNNPIPDPGYSPPSTIGVGITVEQDCVVSGNVVEQCARAGIVAGTNTATRDLSVTGNLVRACPIGIGVSADATNGFVSHVAVTGNIIRLPPAPNNIGQIVPVVFTGTTINRSGAIDYGNQNDTVIGNLRVGNNRAA
jgi:uncharacterized secreted repeat protein (TIGR03808 family)